MFFFCLDQPLNYKNQFYLYLEKEKKPLKLYSKKINMKEGVPEKIDGPVEEIEYDNKKPLTEELDYFCKHLNGNQLKIAHAEHALQVTKILVEANKKLEEND